MLETILFFIVYIMPKILLSLFIGLILLFFSMDVFLFSFPEKALELLCAFIDLVVFVGTLGSCKSLDEFNDKQKKDNSEQIDPFDFL